MRKVYTIIEAKEDGKKDFWQQIGIAYTNKDGSENVYLNALPLDGKLHIREVSDDRGQRDQSRSQPKPKNMGVDDGIPF